VSEHGPSGPDLRQSLTILAAAEYIKIDLTLASMPIVMINSPDQLVRVYLRVALDAVAL